MGCWATSLKHLLHADVWGPSGEVDGRLLDTIYRLASDASHGRTLAAKHQNILDQDWFAVFEHTIAGYMIHFFVFITAQSMYIQRRLGRDGEMLDFRTFSRKELGDHVKPFDWAFKLWESMMESATLDQTETRSHRCNRSIGWGVCVCASVTMHRTARKPALGLAITMLLFLRLFREVSTLVKGKQVLLD